MQNLLVMLQFFVREAPGCHRWPWYLNEWGLVWALGERHLQLLRFSIAQDGQGDSFAGTDLLKRATERFDIGHRLPIERGDDIAAYQDGLTRS
jgi:hypothetical protein